MPTTIATAATTETTATTGFDLGLETLETEVTEGVGALGPLNGAGIPAVEGVAAGGLNDANPEVGAAFEPQVVQNDSCTEIS